MFDSNLPFNSITVSLHNQLMLSIGVVAVALIDGALLSLGIACFWLLRRQQQRPNMYLRIYIVVLVLVNFGYEAGFFIWTYLSNIFRLEGLDKQRKILDIMVFFGKLMPTILIGLTDGLLVWRCYRVQKALGPNDAFKWNILWLFPLCLWFITAVTSIVGGALIETSRLGAIASGIQATGYASNVVLNLFATVYICNRIMYHGRIVRGYLGSDAPTQPHVRIMVILLQSAAINVPITIVGAIGIGTAEFYGLIVATVAIACQSLTSLFVILLIALGRAIEQRGESVTLIEEARQC